MSPPAPCIPTPSRVVPAGTQTPIKEVLQLLKKEKWPIYADVELEYRIPPGSDAVKGVAKCVQYCKEALA
jgi:hypothetical protein